MTTTLRSFRHLTLKERTQIGEFYKEGMKAKDIAPLYETDRKTVGNVIHFLRQNGVQIPFKITPRKQKTPELLVLPEEPKKTQRRKYSNGEKREAYRIYRTTGEIDNVMSSFNVNKKVAYYMVWHGRKLSGVKGKVRVVPHLDHTPTTRLTSDNVGFFALGVVVTLLVMWAI